MKHIPTTIKNIVRRFKFLPFFVLFALPFVEAQNQVFENKSFLLPSGISEQELPAVLDVYFAENTATTAAVEAAVFRGSKIVYRKNAGFAHRENTIAADTETVFEWGSATKLLVWISLMQLKEQSKVQFDVPVQNYLPKNFLRYLVWDEAITIQNLMHHNAGWEDVVTGLFTTSKSNLTNLETALKQMQPRQIYEPGTIVAYSNWGTALAGYIVERISGMTFYEYVQKNIFVPLGMEHTALAPDLSDNLWVQKQRGFVRGYDRTGQNPIPDRFYISLYPAGMATGTLDDFLKFAQSLVPAQGDLSPLFKNRKTLDELFLPTLMYPKSDIPRNSNGFWIQQYGVPVVGHGGNTAAMSAYLLLNPESGYGAVVMTNQGGEQVFNVKMMNLIFGNICNSNFAKQSMGTELVLNTADTAGYFASARTVAWGPAKIYGIAMILPFPALTQLKTAIPSLGGSLEIIAPNLLELQTPVMSSMIVTEPENQENGSKAKKISIPFWDFLRISDVEFFVTYGILIAFAAAGVYGFSMLLTGLVRRLLKKNRITGKFHYLFCAAVFLSLVCFALYVLGLLSYQTKPYLTLLIVLFDIMVVGQLIFLVFSTRQFSRLASRWGKIAHIADLCATTFCLFATIMFQIVPL